MSKVMGLDLKREELFILVQLCELGVNPEALAVVYSEMEKENTSNTRLL